MEPEGSLLHSQAPATCPYPKQYVYIYIYIYNAIIQVNRVITVTTFRTLVKIRNTKNL
jgi:hypothetical protein